MIGFKNKGTTTFSVEDFTAKNIVITAGVGEITTDGRIKKVTHSQGTEFYVDGMRVPTGHYWQNGKIKPTMKKPKTKKRGK